MAKLVPNRRIGDGQKWILGGWEKRMGAHVLRLGDGVGWRDWVWEGETVE